MQAVPRFSSPVSSYRPRRSRRFDVFSPKLDRYLTLYGPASLDWWTMLEANSEVLTFCERPTFVPGTKPQRPYDFWVRWVEREELLLVTPDSEAPEEIFSGDSDFVDVKKTAAGHIELRRVRPVEQSAYRIHLINWGWIIRDLSAFGRFVTPTLYQEVKAAIAGGKTVDELQREFSSYDSTIVKVAAYTLLHRGEAVCHQLASVMLSGDVRLYSR